MEPNCLYSVHAPEVECLAKGKAHTRYEFGCKTSVATTSKSNWVVGTHALHGNPYDGHTLRGAIAQVERLTGQTPQDVMIDQGYRGHGYEGSAIVQVVRSIPKRATRAVRRMLKRRAAIEIEFRRAPLARLNSTCSQPNITSTGSADHFSGTTI